MASAEWAQASMDGWRLEWTVTLPLTGSFARCRQALSYAAHGCPGSAFGRRLCGEADDLGFEVVVRCALP
ncbi:hypothetical protein GCM10010400_46020 [Streptomyces aculeolatus]